MKERESNFELLRILAMLLIIMSHCVTHGVGGYGEILNYNLNFNVICTYIFGIWGGLGVIIFVIITCWFMSEKKNIKIKKVVKITLQTWITCMIIVLILKILKVNITGKDILKEMVTPIYAQYWFITTYLLFYMILPFLQIFVSKMSIEQHKKCVMILTGVIAIYKPLSMLVGETLGNLSEFIYLFILVSYLKRMKNNFIEKNAIKIAITSFSIIILGLVCLNIANQYFHTSIINRVEFILIGRNLLMMILGMAIFYIFKNHVNIGSNKIINTISKTTLGIYIIHENMLLRGNTSNSQPSLIWNNIFHVESYYETGYFIFYYLGICILTFLICFVLEKIREKIIDENILGRIKIIDKMCNKFDNWYSLEKK